MKLIKQEAGRYRVKSFATVFEIERIYESTEWCVKLVIVRPGWENEDKEWEDYEWIYTGHSLKNCKWWLQNRLNATTERQEKENVIYFIYINHVYSNHFWSCCAVNT